MQDQLGENLLNAYVKCKYKAFLLQRGQAGVKSDFDTLQTELDSEFIKIFKEKHETNRVAYRELLFSEGDFSISVPIFFSEKSVKSKVLPFIFNRSGKITKEVKLHLALRAMFAASCTGSPIEHGAIIQGPNFKHSKINIRTLQKEAKQIFDGVKSLLSEKNEPKLSLNKHCKICEFRQHCREEAIKRDDLALLSSLGEKEIAVLKRRGIFTLTQLSYTFRPKRRLKNIDAKKRPRQVALHALAIREQKIHIFSPKEMTLAPTQIFLDVESNAEKDFYYLIGMVIRNDQGSTKYSFWADKKSEAVPIFKEFLAVCEPIKDFSLIHYGSFEASFLKAMAKKSGTEDTPVVKSLVNNSINILEAVYSSIYFPTYSNDLKSIASYLGFKWSDTDASGLQSIVWRTRWEQAGDLELKQKLLTYNIEDCLALELLTDTLNSVLNYKKVMANSGEIAIVRTEDLKETWAKGYDWGGQDFVLPEMEAINKCAYFDYQRDTVFIRTNKKIQKVARQQKRELSKLNQINKKVEILATNCPFCGSNDLSRPFGRSKRAIIDLKFFFGGIKKWIVKYTTSIYLCSSCQRTFYPEQYPSRQKFGSKFGHNFMSWVLYQYIVNGSSMAKIRDDLRELFRIKIAHETLYEFKTISKKYYANTYQQILSGLISGNVVVADEAQVKLRNHSAYIWVFASTQEVIYYYRETRDSSFLDDFLKEFKGVLVTDFFSGYDSLPCPQQKCLIHLMRDLNQDLTENPFDEELKELTRAFTLLLRSMVATVDKMGLKKRFLGKHKEEVRMFFRNIVEKEYESEPALKLQKRFRKNKDKLFTFLDYDGVPWNSNAAEHAIKHLADLRKRGIAKFRKERIDEYLQMLSIYQTCRYRGIGFLQFLLSRETQLN